MNGSLALGLGTRKPGKKNFRVCVHPFLDKLSGKVNKVYLMKSGGKARFKESEFVEVDDPYLLDSWKLVKRICQDMSAAALKIL